MLWIKSVKLVTNAQGQPIDCSHCPCTACSRLQHASNCAFFVAAAATCAWPVATTASSLLVACVGVNGSATVSTPAGWTLAVSKANGANCSIYIFYIKNAATRSGTESFTLSAGNTTAYVELLEYSNPGGGIFDLTSTDSGSSTTPDSGTPGPALTYTNEVCVAAISYHGTSAFTDTDGVFGIVDQQGPIGSDYYGVVADSFVSNGTGTQAAFTGSPSAQWAGAQVTFACNYVPGTACCSNGLPMTLTATVSDTTCLINPVVTLNAVLSGGSLPAWITSLCTIAYPYWVGEGALKASEIGAGGNCGSAPLSGVMNQVFLIFCSGGSWNLLQAAGNLNNNANGGGNCGSAFLVS